MRINERGYWENSTTEGHAHDEGLANALVEFFYSQPRDFPPYLDVWDVGCGDGYYTNYINSKNLGISCIGIDGNPNTLELAGPNTIIADLTDESNLLFVRRQDWVLCLEVGEHIPAKLERAFLNNLHKMNKHGIVLSWAIRGQGGDGHVNCLDNWEVIERIEPMGYTLDMEATTKLRLSAAEYPKPCYWFRNTLMVFRKNPAVCSLGYEMQ